jgi:uncharacterized protein with HEPN domain
MQRDERIYLAHMLSAARENQGYAHGKTREMYDGDLGLRRQLERTVEIIGEAARLTSQTFRDMYPQVPWDPIIGMRHRIVHGYLLVDYNILWLTVTVAIPELIAELEKIVPPEMRAEP